MQDLSQHDRTVLGERLQKLKPQVAEQVTQVFLERHPEWLLKYGEKARKFGIEDAQFHIDFLRGAVEANSIQAFEDYCEWAAGLLKARSIASHFLVKISPRSKLPWVPDYLRRIRRWSPVCWRPGARHAFGSPPGPPRLTLPWP